MKIPTVVKVGSYESPLHVIRRGDSRFPEASETLGSPSINKVIVDTVRTPKAEIITHRGISYKGMKKVITSINRKGLFKKKNTWSNLIPGRPSKFKKKLNLEAKNRGFVK